MAAMPIYVKTLLLQNLESLEAESWYTASGTQKSNKSSKDDTRMTFDLFIYGMVRFVS